MGTRADFYVGRGKEMEWVGSVAWDGYPSGFIESGLLTAGTEDDFRAKLAAMADERDDFTHPSMGWPWPWDDSFTSDFGYAFDGDRVFVSCEGRGPSVWIEAAPFAAEDADETDLFENLPACGYLAYPDMSARKNVDFGSRSGLITLG